MTTRQPRPTHCCFSIKRRRCLRTELMWRQRRRGRAAAGRMRWMMMGRKTTSDYALYVTTRNRIRSSCLVATLQLALFVPAGTQNQ
ncbi:unnamed protein product [Linum tenue]|uniref:Uncharacterized protein n=1 Tax=Linum tenue TaxID=586396 RepID=A0AAV0L9C0_9ROSI|nr:unnamed protein product [Linum tenue]